MKQKALFDTESSVMSEKQKADKKDADDERKRLYDTYKQLFVRSCYQYIGERYLIEQYIIDRCCELIEESKEITISNGVLIDELSSMILSVTREPYTIVYLFTDIQKYMIDYITDALGDLDHFRMFSLIDKAYSVAFYTAAKEKGFK